MEKLIEYKVVDGGSGVSLESKVNNLIRRGWKPQGGASVAIGTWGPTFVQSMIREVKT